jgi:hypothetical protein
MGRLRGALAHEGARYFHWKATPESSSDPSPTLFLKPAFLAGFMVLLGLLLTPRVIP